MSRLRVRLAADPASVPGARRFVTDGLSSWGLDAFVDDVALCVTELAANAALHSSGSFMSVMLAADTSGVRVSVEDDGAVPGSVVVPRVDFADHTAAVDFRDEATTGRGLAIVDVLASRWGVEETSVGKRVWADFGSDLPELPHPENDASTDPAPSASQLPDGWAQVRLADCPVELSLRQDEHLDELVRELQLISADTDNHASRVLAHQIEGLLFTPAHARFTGRHLALQAQAAGLDHVDIDLALPVEASVMIRALQDTVSAADRLCEERKLLTLASSEDLRAIRAWMTSEIVAQIELRRAPVPWRSWRRDAARSPQL